ncbi:MAG: hypothetical protein A3F68_10425 [Acidobacteria bacterium RIFCSPLOWO2_12_FULL_54_10]|nr:MAG: hypothetical protein A3F68_10425 [Acidobacteria bacterium RIFCSPLOWO2_12_FULL_54_10]
MLSNIMMVRSMREELTQGGFKELLTPADVDAFMADKTGTALLFINSVCGCAAGNARPGALMALQHSQRPDRLVTVFAGQDVDATARARSYISPIPPSSPSIALFKDGNLVYFMPRQNIEGRDANAVASDLQAAFAEHCAMSSV